MLTEPRTSFEGCYTKMKFCLFFDTITPRREAGTIWLN